MKARRRSRVLVLRMLYSMDTGGYWDTTGQGVMDVIQTLNTHFPLVDDEQHISEDRPFMRTLALGVVTKRDELDSSLEKASNNWKTSRMDIVDRCILRMGVFEILHMEGVPDAVTISEAIDLAADYGSERSVPFVNGILDEVRRKNIA